MSQKVLQISAEDAKYIDPNQVASITMVDGSTIYVQENVADDGFAEEAQVAGYEQDQQPQQQQQQPAFRGVGTKIAAGLLATGAVVAGAAALGSALKPRGPMIGGPMRGPAMMGPGMMGPGMRGPGMMGPTVMRPGMAPMGRVGMPPMVRPMGGPMVGFRARRQDNTNEEEVCPYCHKWI